MIIKKMADTLYAVRENGKVDFFEEMPRMTVDGWDGHVALSAIGDYYKELYEGEVYIVTLDFELKPTRT